MGKMLQPDKNCSRRKFLRRCAQVAAVAVVCDVLTVWAVAPTEEGGGLHQPDEPLDATLALGAAGKAICGVSEA